MNEERVRELTDKLANSVLGSPMGIEEDGYQLLLSLYEEVFDKESALLLDAAVDATDGYFYFPIGNEAGEENEIRVPDLEDVARALEGRDFLFVEGDIVPSVFGEEEPAYELYDDRAD